VSATSTSPDLAFTNRATSRGVGDAWDDSETTNESQQSAYSLELLIVKLGWAVKTAVGDDGPASTELQQSRLYSMIDSLSFDV